MESAVLAKLDWPVLFVAVVAVAFVLTWRPYRRIARDYSRCFAAGDFAGALDAALRLYQSRLPVAVIQRLFAPGRLESLIALSHCALGRLDDAVAWAERGLRSARLPEVKTLLHVAAACANAERGDDELLDSHLADLASVLEKAPHPMFTHAVVAAQCRAQAGRIDRAVETLHNHVRDLQAPPSRSLLHTVMGMLNSIGRFDDVFTLTGDVPEPNDPLVEMNIVFASLNAARHAERWDLFEQYIDRLPHEIGFAPAEKQLQWISQWAFRAAHIGDRQDLAARLHAMQDIITRCPRDPRLNMLCCELTATTWQILGEHERALQALASIGSVTVSPLNASEQAAIGAASLEALGRRAEAQSRREQGRRLAPLAFWNDPSYSEELQRAADDIFCACCLQPAADQTPAEAPPPPGLPMAPVPPVASAAACAAWPVAVAAMIPLIGSLAGLVLGVLSVRLLTKSNPLLHDRRVGKAALVFAVASLAVAVTIVVNFLVSLHWMRPVENVPATLPTTQFSEEPPFAQPASQPASHPASQPAPPQPSSIAFEEPFSQKFLFFAMLLASVVFHEVAHAVAAFWSGDTTARDQQRFSLNPIRHIDWFGSVILPGFLILTGSDTFIGWAKPVPIVQRRFRRPRRGLLGVTLAGVSLNLLIALVAANCLTVILIAISRLFPGSFVFGVVEPMTTPFIFNVPDPLPWVAAISICKAAIWVNIMLLGLNLLPIPPLDGFGVLQALTPPRFLPLLSRFTGMGMLLLLALIVLDGLSYLLFPAFILAIVLLQSSQLLALMF